MGDLIVVLLALFGLVTAVGWFIQWKKTKK